MPIVLWTLASLGSMFAGWVASDVYQTASSNEALGAQAQIVSAAAAVPGAINKQRRGWWLYLVIGILIFIVLWLLRRTGIIQKLKKL